MLRFLRGACDDTMITVCVQLNVARQITLCLNNSPEHVQQIPTWTSLTEGITSDTCSQTPTLLNHCLRTTTHSDGMTGTSVSMCMQVCMCHLPTAPPFVVTSKAPSLPPEPPIAPSFLSAYILWMWSVPGLITHAGRKRRWTLWFVTWHVLRGSGCHSDELRRSWWAYLVDQERGNWKGIWEKTPDSSQVTFTTTTTTPFSPFIANKQRRGEKKGINLLKTFLCLFSWLTFSLLALELTCPAVNWFDVD